MNVVRCVDLRARRGEDWILNQVCLTLSAGERVALVGVNGSGKTTLLSALVGLVAHEGTIEIGGDTLSRTTVHSIRERVGFVFNSPEDQLLLPQVLEDVAFGLRRAGQEASEAALIARSVLTRLGVSHLETRSVHELSHGQKQRVAIAGAIVNNPPLLLLDEPTAALDPIGKRELAELLESLDSTQLFATHDLELVDRLASRVLLLEDGRIVGSFPDSDAVRSRWGLT